MSAMSDIAFTPAVKRAQERFGVRDDARAYEDNGRPATMDENLKAFIQIRDSFYLATSSAQGRPYIQHRGGLPGFIRIIDDSTLAFADYPGNQQLITAGNLSENDRAFIFFMDYPTQQRVKLWGRAALVTDDEPLIDKVQDDTLPFTIDRAVRFSVEAWDINCRQYIRQRFSEEDVRRATEHLTQKIQELEAEVSRLSKTE